MEALEYKLKTKNGILIVNAIEKLVEVVKLKNESAPEQVTNLQELKVLKQKCEDPDPIVSITACQGVVVLVELHVLALVPTLSGFVAALTSTKNYTGIITSIGSLLVIDLKIRLMNEKTYRCPFSLRSPQHPLITILKQSNHTWLDVYNQIQFLCNHSDEMVAANSIELLRPVLLYILCVPSQLPAGCRRQTWELLLGLQSHPQLNDFLLDILSWLQTDTESELESTVSLYMDFSELALVKQDASLSAALAPALASLAHHLACFGHDPRACLMILSRLIQNSSEANSCVLMLLADTIPSCPAIYLKDIFILCKSLLEQKSCNVMSTKMLECTLVQWLVYPSFLIGEAAQIANQMLEIINDIHMWGTHTGRFFANKWFSVLRPIDTRVNFAAQLCKLSETWQSNPGSIEQWIERVSVAPKLFTDTLQLFLSALFLYTFDLSEVRQSSFTLLLKMVEQQNDLASNMLTLILYKLSEEREPQAQLELLRGLTKMAVQKENVILILHTLETLKTKNRLRSVVIDLYVRLWKEEVRCYPYLEKILQETPEESDDKWEYEIARTSAIKQICEIRPELYSAELVSMLSKILTRCGDVSGSVASSLAMQGITALCAAGIVDITSTWKVLAPKLNRDKRPAVIKSWCEFFGTVPSLHYPSHDYEKLVVEVVIRLWNYTSNSEDIEVVIAALDALSKFNLDQLSLRSLPESYRRGLKLPSSYAKTPVDAARKPEDVLPYIPSECWIQMLQNIRPEAMEAAGKMLGHWLSLEVAGFHLNPGRMEPISYSHLPPQCVSRALVQYLSKTDVSSEKMIVKECLRIFSQDFVKPLPPLNWEFLKEFIDDDELQEYCITIAAKQAATSPSARKLIENFIVALEPNKKSKDEILMLFSNLIPLCKGIPPNILKPFVEKSLHAAFEFALDNNSGSAVNSEVLLKKLLSHVKTALQKEDIHDANRTVLSLIAEGLLEKLNVDNPFFTMYVDCVVELPTKYLERMSSPSVWWEVTPDKLRLSLGIRSALAQRVDTEMPLVWLNECIDATASLPGEHTNVLKSIVSVMASCRKHETNCPWTMELMGRIQLVANSQSNTDNQQVMIFLCDVFIITAIVMSGHECLSLTLENIASSREIRMQLFPQALASLLIQDQWRTISSHVMEWLFHMNKTNALTALYTTVFYQGLVSLRHNTHLKQSSNMLQFIESKPTQ